MLSLDSNTSQFGLFIDFLQAALLAAECLRAAVAKWLGTEECILNWRYWSFLGDWRGRLECGGLCKVVECT